MAEIEVAGSDLIVHITGADQFFALASRLAVPLEHVVSVDVCPPEAHQIWHGLRIAGTNMPGLITAGRFIQQGEWAFWDVHDPSKAIAIRLRDDHYAKLVIGVEDPTGTAASIRSAIARR